MKRTVLVLSVVWVLAATAPAYRAFQGEADELMYQAYASRGLTPNATAAQLRPVVPSATALEDANIVVRDPLDWSIVKKATGETRWEHIQLHGVNDTAKPLHGVFDNR